MADEVITDKDREMAAFCRDGCPICVHGRKKQKGLAYWFMRNIESDLCPYCKAYEKVYGKKAHEPIETA